MTEKQIKRYILVLSISFLLVGTLFSVKSLYLILNAYKSKSWPTVNGIIVSSEIEQKSVMDSHRKQYRLKIFYYYYVNNEKYESERISFSEKSYPTKIKAQEQLDKYTKNSNIKVFYNPQNPTQSVIEPGWDWQNWGSIIIGVICFLIGIVGLICVRKIEFV